MKKATAPLIVLMEDEMIHTAANNYRCDDLTCPCRQDRVYEPNGSKYHAQLCQSCGMMVSQTSLKVHVCPSR